MNRYFNNTLDLIGGTKARASDVEDNFTSVDNGFGVVQAEMDAKAPLANPDFSGVPTAPTAPNGTSNYQIATTQFVANQAFTSVLPGQGGNAGKVLSTNGTAASWEVNAPAWGNVTGKPTTLAGYSIDPAAARTELGATTVGNAVFTAANAAAGRTALGATTVGANVFTAADALAARTALGGGLIGQDVFIAATAAAARTAMGVTPVNIGAAASGANTDITSLTSTTGTLTINGVVGGYAGRTVFGGGQRAIRKDSASHNLELVNETNTAVTHVFGNDGSMLSIGTGGLGYGAGSGGTVTQATSKSTAVTLNKPTGRITMAGDAMGAGASIGFTLFNSLIGANDVLVANTVWAGGVGFNYRVDVSSNAGSPLIRVTNLTAGTLSEAVQISFAIIKGATT